MKSCVWVFSVLAVAGGAYPSRCWSQSAEQNDALPARLIKVTLVQKHEGVEVRWNTDSTNERTSYEIERSTDSINFTKVGRMTSSVGNNIPGSYFDNNLPNANTVYYRLRGCNTTNGCNYSEVRSIKINRQKSVRVYPVITTNNIRVTYDAAIASDVLVMVFNSYGNEVHREGRKVTQGLNDINLIIENLPRGYYVLKMIQGSMSESVSFVK